MFWDDIRAYQFQQNLHIEKINCNSSLAHFYLRKNKAYSRLKICIRKHVEYLPPSWWSPHSVLTYRTRRFGRAGIVGEMLVDFSNWANGEYLYTSASFRAVIWPYFWKRGWDGTLSKDGKSMTLSIFSYQCLDQCSDYYCPSLFSFQLYCYLVKIFLPNRKVSF